MSSAKNLNPRLFLPFLLTGLVIAMDQGIKSFIANNWPPNTYIRDVFGNDLLWIIHVRNKVIAFSLGQGLPELVRQVLFIVVPALVLILLIWYYFKTNELNLLQRWAIAGITGGGIGNLIDRIFRPEGVVDFISVKFYGLFGFDRWPTFNIADSSVVVCVFIFIISMILQKEKPHG
ncbi:MAG: signal peptidase II [Spirochaetaceae bacterium]|jgi:signal peptidase II|nr:signal peptidase II [Spirochaetaceae bacterium]